MAIQLSPETRGEAVAALQAYSAEAFDEPLGNLGAGALLDFVIEEIGPSLYNQGITDAQARMHARITELDVELLALEFPRTRR